MLITKTNPSGIDWYIQNLQTDIHNKLLFMWNVSSDQYKAYGLCYRNKTADGYVAETFVGGNDYKEVYWDDNLTAISFFGLSGSVIHKVQSEANIHLLFFVDLNKLQLKDNTGTIIAHRSDVEARQKVESIVRSYGFELVSTELWLENVLREYNGSIKGNLKAADMHPLHCFRLNLKLNYNPNKIC